MAIRTAFSAKTAAAALAAITLAGALTMPSAEARYGRNGAAIAGIVGVLAAGALIAGAANARAQPHPGYYADPYAGYAPQTDYQPRQTYYQPHPVYEQEYSGYHQPRHNRRTNMADVGFDNVRQSCTTKKQMVWDGYGYVKHKYLACR